MNKLLKNRLRNKGAWERVLRERLSEPLHLNTMSAFVWLFGSWEAKVYHDLIFRQYTAFCILDAARRARSLGLSGVTALEFGVATGAGLLNMCEAAANARAATGVDVRVVGFDTGSGLPPVRDYRDHPELYQRGDYDMQSPDILRAKLPAHGSLIIGEIADTVADFREQVSPAAPIGYIALDVDYYFSAVDALHVFEGAPDRYLPFVNMYLDDCHDPHHNPSAGELLALREFNEAHPLRQIHPWTALREKRLFKNASWISKIFAAHILDHPRRTPGVDRGFVKKIENPYMVS
jgi:hypothetical protein